MRSLVVLALAAALAACSFAPKYERPPAELPQAWRSPADGTPAPGDRWWSLFDDPVLDKLVDEALANNQDLAIAVARVDEARALARVQESQQYPSVVGNAGVDRSRTSSRTDFFFPGVPVYSTNYRATLDVFYEIDLWGRLRNASAAARADLLATEAARDTVRIALAAEVVRSYSALRAFDEQVAATQRALALRTDALEIERSRAAAGLVSELDVRQLEGEVAAARALLPALERARAAEEGAAAVLLGRSPRAIIDETIARASGPDTLEPAVVVPPGLPSELLLRRPDLFAAEQRLLAANARIGVARAAFFPQISLTGYLGTEAGSLSNLFTGPAGIWQVAAGLTQPIFQGGRLFAEADAVEARQRQAVAQYQKTIQNAFREVRDAISAQARAREVYAAEGARVAAQREALKLAAARYRAGLVNLLVPIDAERRLLDAELNRIDALRVQRAAVADLVRALGGGWTAPED
ncbi:MAG: efflux transporter outer membrane subunit, partial [Burkholderiales bacterium]